MMGSRVFPLGPVIEPGPPKESHRIQDHSGFLLVSITLRDGAEVPSHVAKEPIIVTCLAGAGDFIVEDGREIISLEPGTVVTLAAGVRHGLRARPALRVTLVRIRQLGPEAP